jgi:hypothetical protein
LWHFLEVGEFEFILLFDILFLFEQLLVFSDEPLNRLVLFLGQFKDLLVLCVDGFELKLDMFEFVDWRLVLTNFVLRWGEFVGELLDLLGELVCFLLLFGYGDVVLLCHFVVELDLWFEGFDVLLFFEDFVV